MKKSKTFTAPVKGWYKVAGGTLKLIKNGETNVPFPSNKSKAHIYFTVGLVGFMVFLFIILGGLA